MEKWWVRRRIRKVRAADRAALLMFCGKTVIWGVPWRQYYSQGEIPAGSDVLGGWVGFSSLFQLLIKLDHLSPLFLKVCVVSVWGRNCSGILCEWNAMCAWCNSAVHGRGSLVMTEIVITGNQCLFRHSLEESMWTEITCATACNIGRE